MRTGKTALSAGSTSGIGLGIALGLAKRGAVHHVCGVAWQINSGWAAQ